MKICFHSVSPQNKPSVTLREPSRRGHSGLSSAWHPAPLLPTGTGQGAVRLAEVCLPEQPAPRMPRGCRAESGAG